jgi:TonB-linked SusC/RagA family outer membrane protein
MKRRLRVLRYLLLFLAVTLASAVHAQEYSLKGTVTDATDGSSIPGVTVLVKGTSSGTVTDINGTFTINVKPGDVLAFSFVGYTTQEIEIKDQKVLNVILASSVTGLNEVVVIGYGQVKKSDATGAVATLGRGDFNEGAITSPQELMIGKIAGVQVTTLGGAPGGAAQVRIRGAASISASQDPLVVIDGVPLDNSETSGARGNIAMINPNDIESYTILKDASSTAIYGSRASNGVIMITTKKGAQGGKKFGVQYSGYVSMAAFPKTVQVLSGDAFRSLMGQRYPDSLSSNIGVDSLIGVHSTDWQNEIYQTAINTDHNISVYGAFKTMPYRVSVGYLYQNGTLLTDNVSRVPLSVNLNPSFFKNYLTVNANAKFIWEQDRFADNGAIGDAIAFDPTQPVDTTNSYGNYWAWLQPDGTPVNQATTNPVALLNLREDKSHVFRFLGNIQLNYKLHFFPDLKVVLNLGGDFSNSDGTVYVPEYATWVYLNQGTNNKYYQTKKNEVLDFYLNYVKDVPSIKSRFDVMAGYSWQWFYNENKDYNSNVPGEAQYSDTAINKKEYYLISFYGRLNYSLMDRYLFTFTLRDDGSSKFSSDNRWGLFPSFALAWKISDEKFLRNSKTWSLLKLRVGWGQTGQQDITDNWYPYIPFYTASDGYAMYQFGNFFYTTLRPDGYDPNIKWEKTGTWNVGVDYGFLHDRITGALDFYYRKTNDLINYIPVPAGSNLSNYITTNVGDMNNQGVEFSIDGRPIVSKTWNWEVGGNVAYNKNEITRLTQIDDPTYPGVLVGQISGGVGNTVQVHTVGYPMYSFYVYQQVYDTEGNPIEGLYVDRNGDGKITDADRYHYKTPTPIVTFGIFSNLKYKNWALNFSGHAGLGNYVYNNVEANRGVYSNLYRPEGPYLSNVTNTVFDVNFNNNQYLSDYYVQQASYFKLDYLTLSYNFASMVKKLDNLTLSFTVNNVFTITKYIGIDPEVNLGSSVGIDNNMYPRSRVFLLGVNLSL